jgi:uncharacterized protein YbjT (DUF2867 family)
MTNEFWHNKRVMVTGGNGFLGKYIVRNPSSFGGAQDRSGARTRRGRVRLVAWSHSRVVARSGSNVHKVGAT